MARFLNPSPRPNVWNHPRCASNAEVKPSHLSLQSSRVSARLFRSFGSRERGDSRCDELLVLPRDLNLRLAVSSMQGPCESSLPREDKCLSDPSRSGVSDATIAKKQVMFHKAKDGIERKRTSIPRPRLSKVDKFQSKCLQLGKLPKRVLK